MARELLTQALVSGHYAGAPKDPALLPAYRTQTLAQALMAQGVDSTPAYPMQALGRLAQAIAGSYLMNQGNDEIGAYTAQRKADTDAAMKALLAPVETKPAATMMQPPQAQAPAALPASMKPYVPQNLPPGITPEEDILTRTVIGEAGGEPPVGQQAVASVIRNRINQSGRGISDVVFAPNQFEPWNNATTRAKLEGLDPASPEYQTVLNNIRAGGDDPTKGATHFYSPTAQSALGRQPPSWASGEPSAVIGRHNFYNLGYGPGSGTPGALPAPVQVASAGNVATDASLQGPSTVSGTGDAQQAAVPAAGSSLVKEGMTRLQRAIHVATIHPENEAIQDAAKLEMENARALILQGRHEESLAAAYAARKEARGYHVEDLTETRRLAAENRVPHTITAQDPDGKGIGIYELKSDATLGKRIGNAPKQPGEGGPFSGTAMEAQANNVLLSVGPKITAGTATEAEKGQYALAYEHLAQGKIMAAPDLSDPTGQRQQLVRIPGSIPPMFPAPPGAAPPAAPALSPGQAPPATPSAPPTTTPAATSAQTPAAAAAAVPGAPIPIPGTVKAAPPTTDTEKTAAGFALRTREAGKVLDALEAKGIHTGNTGQALRGGVPVVGNFLTSPDYQVYQQQMQDWVRAKLRRESGAVIGKEEMADEIKTYFPEPGDSPEKIASKQKSRANALKALEESAGRARIESAPAAPSGAIPAPPPGFKVIE